VGLAPRRLGSPSLIAFRFSFFLILRVGLIRSFVLPLPPRFCTPTRDEFFGPARSKHHGNDSHRAPRVVFGAEP